MKITLKKEAKCNRDDTTEPAMNRDLSQTAFTRSRRSAFRPIFVSLAVLAAVVVPAGTAQAQGFVESFDGGAFVQDSSSARQAGSHPYKASAEMVLKTETRENVPGGGSFSVWPIANGKDLKVELPPGFLGNPTIGPRCTASRLIQENVGTGSGVTEDDKCPPEAQVGTIRYRLHGTSGDGVGNIYNLVPPPGVPAMFGFAVPYLGLQLFYGTVRTDGDYGVDVDVRRLTQGASLLRSEVTFWGTPADSSHDSQRGRDPFFVLSCGTPTFDCSTPSTATPRAFLSLPTSCVGPVETRLTANAWQPGFSDAVSFFTHEAGEPGNLIGNEGCELPPFQPSISLKPTVAAGDSSSGLDVSLTLPQDGLADPDGLATAHLKDTKVRLADGLTMNPAAADGLVSCSTAQIGLMGTNFPMPSPIRFDKEPDNCPPAAKIGTLAIDTPLLGENISGEEDLTGSVYLASQSDNPFSSDFAIYLVAEGHGVRVKLAGAVEPDPQTGQLTTTVSNNPQLPFSRFDLNFKTGPRAPLASPVTCGDKENENQFTSHALPDAQVPAPDGFQIESSPAGGCPATPQQRPLNVGFSAGSTEIVGGAHSPFTVRLARPDGNQEFDSVQVTTPRGLTAKLAGVPYCPEAGIDQAIARTATGDGALEQQSPSCPASSQVGTTTIGAGAGSQPFFVKGKVYLAGPYKGAPVSLAFVVPAVAGPFDLGVQVVRTALNVNPVTAQVTAASDTIPKILRGVPLRLRDIRVDIDRSGFTINPTDCSAQLVTGKVTGSHGASTDVSNRFQVAECARMGFKPSIDLRLFGGVTRAKYQGVRAVVRPRPGDANISGAVVRFPSSAFVAQEHLQNICTRVQWAADACPANSVYGTAEAISPLLDEPLKGNVHLRSSSNLLPDLVADLRGPANQPIRVEVAMKTDSVNTGKEKGALRSTVTTAPDAPVSLFRLQVFGGKKALIVNSENICRGKNAAQVSFAAHNGRRSTQAIPVRNAKCGKWRKAQKRKAAQKRKRMIAAKRLAARN